MNKAGFFYLVFLSTAIYTNAQDTSYTQNYKMALGARFSSRAALVNTSVSFRYFFNEKTAAEFLVGVTDPFAFGLLVERYRPALAPNFQLFYGAGAYAGFSGSRRGGVHGIAGLDYTVPKLPLNLSIDWKPELTFFQEFSFEPAALGVSVRFAFH